MEAESFGALASSTSLGLLADRVVLALEGLERTPSRDVPDGYRPIFKQAEVFLEGALDAKRRQLPRVVSKSAVSSDKAYHRAILAARVAERPDREAAPEGIEEVERHLKAVLAVLSKLGNGVVEGDAERRTVRIFFRAVSDVATAEHDRLSARRAVYWRGEA